MTNDNEDKFARFMKEAETNLSRRCCAHVACVYFLGERGPISLATNVVLAPASAPIMGEVGPRLVDVGGIRAVKGRVPFPRVAELLAGVQAGIVPERALPTGCEGPLDLRRRDSTSATLWSAEFYEAKEMQRFGLRLAGHVLHSYGSDSREVVPEDVWREVEDRLPACDPPFAGFAGLARDLGIGEGMALRSSSAVYVISPYWLRLDFVTERASKSTIEVGIESAWKDLRREATISLVPRTPAFTKQKVRRTIAGSGWKTKAGIRVGSLPTKQGVGPCDLFLNYGGRRIESRVTGIGYSRLVAHELVDPDFDQLRRRLRGGKGGKDAQRFEEGVAWLLHLCGLSVVHYGSQDLLRATDIVAFLDDDCAVYAECSVEAPGFDKQQKVLSRARELKQTLLKRGNDPWIIPAVFCARSQLVVDAMEADDDETPDAQIVVLGTEQMDRLLRLARQAEDPGRVFLAISLMHGGRKYVRA